MFNEAKVKLVGFKCTTKIILCLPNVLKVFSQKLCQHKPIVANGLRLHVLAQLLFLVCFCLAVQDGCDFLCRSGSPLPVKAERVVRVDKAERVVKVDADECTSYLVLGGKEMVGKNRKEIEICVFEQR